MTTDKSRTRIERLLAAVIHGNGTLRKLRPPRRLSGGGHIE
jgi:hypothetical protein